MIRMKNALIVAAASAATAVALVLGGAAAADAATPTPSPSPSSGATCSLGEHLIHGWFELPKALRTDLQAARKADKADKAKDLADIRAKALAGGYGKVVEARVKDLKSLDLRPLPAALKADLKTLHGEKTKADKQKEADAIAQKAVAGGYGSGIQKLAKDVQSSKSFQSCTPGAKKGAKSSASGS
jgi:hypothetical protein